MCRYVEDLGARGIAHVTRDLFCKRGVVEAGGVKELMVGGL